MAPAALLPHVSRSPAPYAAGAWGDPVLGETPPPPGELVTSPRPSQGSKTWHSEPVWEHPELPPRVQFHPCLRTNDTANTHICWSSPSSAPGSRVGSRGERDAGSTGHSHDKPQTGPHCRFTTAQLQPSPVRCGWEHKALQPQAEGRVGQGGWLGATAEPKGAALG